jgi:putative transposase
MPRKLLEPGCVYHIYTHAVGNDNLFLSEENYRYFLRRYEHFIAPIANTFAYCLVPNHLHLLIELKQQLDVPIDSKYNASQFASKQFSNLFSSYAQAFNKQQMRKGNLFMSNFKRRRVNSDEYLTNVIKYIHLNPVAHGIVQFPLEWKFSSYGSICSDCTTFLARESVLAWFGGVQNFRRQHEAF